MRLDERTVREVRVNAFESAALPHLNSIYRTAVGLLGDRNEAQDLTQDVYLHDWKSFHRFELRTNCRAWLFKILFNRLHHHRRKWYQLRLAKEGEEGLEELLVYEPPVPQRLTDEDVLAAVEKVPEVLREVLLLSDVEDFSYKEIAATLEIPVGTVMSRLNRARRSIARLTGRFCARLRYRQGRRCRLQEAIRMSVIRFDQARCAAIRGYLNSYLSNELLLETNHEVLSHLEACPDCARELEERTRVRELLRRAISLEAADPALRVRIRQALQLEEKPHRSILRWQWATAMAAMFFLLIGGIAAIHLSGRYREQIASLLGAGVTDHIECTVAGHFPKEPSSAAKMAEEMGSGYFQAVALVQDKVPEYTLREGHVCDPGGRSYYHIILSREDKLVSVVMTKKRPGESFPRNQLAKVLRATHDGLYQDRLENVEVAGFETRDHLAYVVSNLAKEQNMQIAAALAPGLGSLLKKIEA